MADRQKITFHQEGDQAPGFEPGDIVIVLDQKPHPVFQRSGSDLIVRREVPLVDALCGCKQVIRTLDNRRLLVSSRPGEQLGAPLGLRGGRGRAPSEAEMGLAGPFPGGGGCLLDGAAAHRSPLPALPHRLRDQAGGHPVHPERGDARLPQPRPEGEAGHPLRGTEALGSPQPAPLGKSR